MVGRGRGYGGCDIAVDLRVDDSPEPLTELARLYDLHQLYFGSTPEEQWLTVDPELRVQLAAALAKLGYSTGEFKNDSTHGPAPKTSRNASAAQTASTP